MIGLNSLRGYKQLKWWGKQFIFEKGQNRLKETHFMYKRLRFWRFDVAIGSVYVECCCWYQVLMVFAPERKKEREREREKGREEKKNWFTFSSLLVLLFFFLSLFFFFST